MGDMPDLSSLLGMLNNKGIDLNNIISNLSNNSSTNTFNDSNNTNQTNSSSNFEFNNSTNQDSDERSNFQMPDMETMMRIMKIINSINSNTPNPSANLLYSLKPFLRDSKKEKIDQYINFLKISSILSEMNKSGGDKI